MTKTIVRFIIACYSGMFLMQPACAQYQVNHFTTENGLPSNGIKALQWDDTNGFLWIATEAGVVRYDGMSFKTFDVTTNPEFGSNRIVGIVKNYYGKIMVEGEEGNISMINENNVSMWFNGSSLPKYNYNHYCALAASDTLFKQCYNNPWDQNKYSIYNFTIVPLNDTASVVLIKGELYYYSVSTAQPELIKASPLNIMAAFTIDGQLYFLDAADELFSFDLYKKKYEKLFLTDEEGKPVLTPEKSGTIFWESGMENPIIIKEGKAWVIEKANNGQVQCRLIASGIPENTFFKFAKYKKKGDYLFLGSASKGVYIIHENQLLSKQPAIKVADQHNSFYSQIELPDGNILTNEGVIIGDTESRNNFGILTPFINNVYFISDTTFIYNIKDTLFRFNIITHSNERIFNGHINDHFAVAYSNNQLYFSNSNGIGLLTGDSLIISKYFAQDRRMMSGIFTMLEIAPGKLAIATCEGLLGFDTKTRNIDTILKIPSVCVRSLYKDGDYVFIGTYGGGYYVWKQGVLKPMPLDINQYLKYTHCFVKDDKGFCWISTNNGLFKAKMSDMIDAYEKNIPQIYYHYLGKDDGMQTTEMNGGCEPCAIKLRNDYYSFPTMDGLLWFKPANTNIELPSGKIFIDKMVADGKQVSFTDSASVQLPQNVKKLDIIVALNAWCKKENLYMDYRLNDDPWQRIEIIAGEPRISLSDLSYGDYILQIRKLNGFGINNYSYSAIAFTIATPFYHQWWFRILVLLLLAGAGYLVFKFRLRQYAARQKKLERLIEQKTMDLNTKNIQLEKNNRIKLRLISIINHDIMTPLKFMHYAGKALVENKGSINEEQRFQTIAEITETAKDMEQLSSQILNWIIYHNPNQQMQKEEFDLHQLIETIFRVLKFPAKEKNTRLQNDVPVNFVVYQYMEAMRVMIYNLVANSLNFTCNGTITVSCSNENDRIMLEVTDTGLGMTEEQVNNILSDERIIASVNIDNKKGTGLGYLIIKDLQKMMLATIHIKSVKNEGTSVFVSIPVA